MTQSEVLRLIARHGYNVGFGAKKGFATYDLICRASGQINLTSPVVGVFALSIPELATGAISAILIISGAATMHIQFYDPEKQSHESVRVEQTEVLNELEVIYHNVKSDVNLDCQRTQQSIDAIASRFYGTVTSKQIFGSNWYTHYKFYCESEEAWIEEELNLALKDKIPLSLCFLASLVVIFTIVAIWKTP